VLVVSDERIGDPHILEASCDERLRFADLCHRDTAGAVSGLLPRDRNRLVRLGVRAQPDVVVRRFGVHLCDVAA
jgi:hypothetical protein